MNLKNIHIIRGLAALLVVVYHSKFVLWCGGTEYVNKIGLHSFLDYIFFGVDMLSSCGKQSVIIFFILSAFVITHSFRNKPSIPFFFKIRLIRIYLPFIASVCISVIVLYSCVKYLIQPHHDIREYTTRLFTAFNEINIITLIKTLIFVPNKEYLGFNFAYWSLLHEGIFYILFPLYFRLSNKLLVILCPVFVVLSLVTNTSLFYYQTFFIIGILTYNNLYVKNWRFSINSKLLLAVSLALYVSINIFVKFHLDYVADILTVFLFLGLLYFLMTGEFKNTKLLNKLAEQSFTLYLFHLPVLMLYFSVLSYYTGQSVFYDRWPYYSGVVIAVLTCMPLYYLFELRFPKYHFKNQKK